MSLLTTLQDNQCLGLENQFLPDGRKNKHATGDPNVQTHYSSSYGPHAI